MGNMEVHRTEAVPPSSHRDARKQQRNEDADDQRDDGEAQGQALSEETAAVRLGGLLFDEPVSDALRHAFNDMVAELDLMRHRLEVAMEERDAALGGTDHHAFLPTLNRTGFLHELSRLIHRMEQTQAEAHVVLLTLENAQTIRLREGREGLDKALKQLLEVLQAPWVQALSVGCLGGSDFALVLLEGGDSGVKTKIRDIAERLSHVTSGAGLHLSIRFGYAALSAGTSAKASVQAADQAMMSGIT